MKMHLLRVYATGLIVASIFVGTNSARANTGTQIPLSQYQAGSIQTTPNLVSNPGFETVNSGIPDKWLKQGNMQAAAPLNPPPPAAGSVGNFAAQMLTNQPTSTDPEQYRQTDNNVAQKVFTFNPAQQYQISAYMWNFGRPDPTPPGDFTTGDLVIAELDDVTNSANNVNVTLERVATDNGDGANGYFVYNTFMGSQFPSGATLDVRGDLNESLTATLPNVYGQIDNVSITPVPEPVGLTLLALGLPLLRRRR